MSITYVQEPDRGGPLARALASPRIALDLEAAGFHRYSDRICLVQVTTPDERTWILDALAFEVGDVLRPALEDPGVEVVMHGADFDIRLLDRDLGIHLTGLFDTQAAAALLGEQALGLASLLEEHLGVEHAKKHQRADWARRPLPDDMIRYAAEDTRHLFRLADLLRARLEAKGRIAWAEEESRLLQEIRWEEDGDEDPVSGVDGARDLDGRALARLREALDWRDEIARERDRALFRVVGDEALLEAAARRPRSTEELSRFRGMSPDLARSRGKELLARFDRVDRRPGEELEPYPREASRGRERPSREVEERAGR
nr:ribonuclease D [Gemmatimonadota bacterium]NIR80717.1 ribonuclease D [Gemmatimonadota bacterium]NIT86804.1 ribonuclease D [Gemmatimonadota bacterium]NIU33315.1 ribonuclease D [Gemmatimonadota bacterium]NIU37605.1 ribonuclease D [Gemmatimonadota bacterium]